MRSHADLGTNWSITLEVREQHTLVTRGVYARVRHPMYTALLLYALGQWLVVPNWLVAPEAAGSGMESEVLTLLGGETQCAGGGARGRRFPRLDRLVPYRPPSRAAPPDDPLQSVDVGLRSVTSPRVPRRIGRAVTPAPRPTKRREDACS
ncbi:MAG: isoprenylcysteine carboxylmethyltransferase family protein [Planctomycetes bacterium]|nr:isoprenylcysteine carboxylmethyltransferase family protein [Planctomycetota bacterium]